MNKEISVKLFLGEDSSVSELKTKIYEEELMELNNSFPLLEGNIDIKKTYILKSENNLEIGFFIRNGLTQTISLEVLPLLVQDKEGNNLVSENVNFKGNGIIPASCGKPFMIKFPLEKVDSFNKDEEYFIRFGELNNMRVFSSVNTEIENISEGITFEEEKAIRDFANELDTLKANEFTISSFNLQSKGNGRIGCTILLRNGTSQIANLERLPVFVVNDEGKTIANSVFQNNEGFKINPGKSKIIKFEFNINEILVEEYDLSKCSVMFKQ